MFKSFLPSMVANHSNGCALWRWGSIASWHELALAYKDPTTPVGEFFRLVCCTYMQDGFTDLDAIDVSVQLVRRKA